MRPSRKKQNELSGKLNVCTFGGLSIYYQGSPITIIWESQKARLLFCYLLINYDQWTHRDKLIEMMWPGSDLGAGLNNFKTTLSRLRKSFSGSRTINPVIVQGEAVRINYSVITVDTSYFKAQALNGIKLQARGEAAAARECLEAAQDLYTGEFLSDEPLNPLISCHRQELADLYAHVLRSLSKVYQQEGNEDGLEAMAILGKSWIPVSAG